MYELHAYGVVDLSIYLFVIRDCYPALWVHCEAIWFSIPFCFDSDILVCIDSQYPAIRDIDNVEISRRSVYWSFEEDVLEGSSKPATPF